MTKAMIWGRLALGAAVLVPAYPLNSLATTPEEARALEDYLTPAEVAVEEVPDLGPGSMGNLDFLAPFVGVAPEIRPLDGGDDLDTVERIINIGKKLWEIVEKNQPVVDVSSNVAHAVPEGQTSWRDLEGWEAPRSRVFRVSYKNLFRMTVVSFTYRVLYTPGGRIGPHGRYLANVTVVPADLQVAWGYRFSAGVVIPQVVNVGTRQDPVAGVELLLKWTVSTVFKRSDESTSYFVQGDGTFIDLNDERARLALRERLGLELP